MWLLSSLNAYIEMLVAKLYLGHSMTLLAVTLAQMSSTISSFSKYEEGTCGRM